MIHASSAKSLDVEIPNDAGNIEITSRGNIINNVLHLDFIYKFHTHVSYRTNV